MHAHGTYTTRESARPQLLESAPLTPVKESSYHFSYYVVQLCLLAQAHFWYALLR